MQHVGYKSPQHGYSLKMLMIYCLLSAWQNTLGLSAHLCLALFNQPKHSTGKGQSNRIDLVTGKHELY